MKILFKVDQRAAIRRGVNSAATVNLEVDVSSLTLLQRDFLADHFKDGAIAGAILNEPTLEGFNEWLGFALKNHAEKIAREKRLVADAMRSMKAREVSPDNEVSIYARRELDDSVTFTEREVITQGLKYLTLHGIFKSVTISRAVSEAYQLIHTTPEYVEYRIWLNNERARIFKLAEPLAHAALEKNERSAEWMRPPRSLLDCQTGSARVQSSSP